MPIRRRPAALRAAAATSAGLSFDEVDGIAATGRGLLLDAQKGFAFVVDCTQAKEFALAHRRVNGADGGRLFVRCFGGCGSAWGPGADRRRKLLIRFAREGSRGGADPHHLA